MFKKIILASVVVVLVFAPFAAGKVKYLPLKEFGIRVAVKNFYSKVGKTYTGTVIDPVKLQYMNEIFRNAGRGDKVKVTNLGNGQVRLKNLATGESETLEVRVQYSAYDGIVEYTSRGTHTGPDASRNIVYADRSVPRVTAPRMTTPRMTTPRVTVPRMTTPKPRFEVTQDVNSVVTAIKTRFTSREIRQIVNGLEN
ncbi:MAG: hypothetical protein GY795_29660 [Desulfobacterales bacterium]|nr:hypothetical protein [Desulfobacterales bacterium]